MRDRALVAIDLIPASVGDAVIAGKGLILCVGERSIGRSELLGSLTQHAAKDPSQYVVVVDDEPVTIEGDGALVVQRQYGINPAVRADVLRSVVSEDPDVMVIADVGSPETFELAMRAAEGGRLVIAYLDARNVVHALMRIFNFYPSYDLSRVRVALAAVLRSVLVRQLLPNATHTDTVPATELLIVQDAVREILRAGFEEVQGQLQGICHTGPPNGCYDAAHSKVMRISDVRKALLCTPMNRNAVRQIARSWHSSVIGGRLRTVSGARFSARRRTEHVLRAAWAAEIWPILHGNDTIRGHGAGGRALSLGYQPACALENSGLHCAQSAPSGRILRA